MKNIDKEPAVSSTDNKTFYLLLISSLILILAGLFIKYSGVEFFSSKTNILKAKKIESALLNSDFYIHLTKYKKGKVEAEYAELIPTITTISYSVSNLNDTTITLSQALVETSLKQNDTNSSIDLASIYSEKFLSTINELRRFSQTYGTIVATQNPNYITYADKHAVDIVKGKSDVDVHIQSTKKSDSYETLVTPLIPNLKIDYFKKDNSFKVKNIVEKTWNPDIVTWANNSGSTIHLQLLKKSNKLRLKKVVKNMILKSDAVLASISSHNKNYDSNVYLTWENNQSSIEAYFLDESSSYIYLLTLQTQDTAKEIDDYLKIAMGIGFVLSTDNNQFLDMQKEVQEYSKNFCRDEFIYSINRYNDTFDNLS